MDSSSETLNAGHCIRYGGTNQKEPAIRDKYTTFAPFYDLLSGEYPVYHAGRVLGIDALAPTPGQQVLDIGCGTGLNFTLLQQHIGGTGTIVGIDRSTEMLRQARRRADRRGWGNVILIRADMTTLDPSVIRTAIDRLGGSPASGAAVGTYSLSLMPGWRTAWENMTLMLGGDARVSVVDMQDPAGRARWLTPLARFACALGGADSSAHPWQAVEEECVDVVRASAWGGHIQIRAGRLHPGTA
ncbi:MAG: methyltransferase domain-containing protein [Actinomycetota bacterium]|nr:methyltransferase domain-containing protein [Actinomycetota bacterium]